MKNDDKLGLSITTDCFKAILEAAIGPAFVKNDKYEVILANDAFVKMVGTPKSKIIGQTMEAILPEGQSRELADNDKKVLESGKTLLSDEKLTGRGGEVFEIVIKRTRYVDADGKKFMVGVIYDVTDSKANEDSLKEEVLFGNAVIESIAGPFYLLDDKGTYVRWNEYEREQIIGKPEEEVAGSSALDTIHPDDRALVKSRIENVLVKNGRDAVEARVLLRGGPEFKWFLLTGRRITIDGKFFLVGMGIDISEFKKAEDEVMKIKKAIEIMNIGFYEIVPGESGTILNCNNALAKIFDLDSKKDMIGKQSIDFYVDPAERQRQTQEIIKHKILLNSEAKLKTYKGRIINAEMSIVMMNNADNQVSVIGLIEDISNRKSSEKVIKDKFEEIKKMNDFMVGREVKMSELKEEVEKLRAKLEKKTPPRS